MRDEEDLIATYKARDENLSIQLDSFVQKLQRAHSQEKINLHETITLLRQQLDETKENQKDLEQAAIVAKNLEIKNLREAVVEVRAALESVEFEKKEAIQKIRIETRDEIENLKNSVKTLRTELERKIGRKNSETDR